MCNEVGKRNCFYAEKIVIAFANWFQILSLNWPFSLESL